MPNRAPLGPHSHVSQPEVNAICVSREALVKTRTTHRSGTKLCPGTIRLDISRSRQDPAAIRYELASVFRWSHKEWGRHRNKNSLAAVDGEDHRQVWTAGTSMKPSRDKNHLLVVDCHRGGGIAAPSCGMAFLFTGGCSPWEPQAPGSTHFVLATIAVIVMQVAHWSAFRLRRGKLHFQRNVFLATILAGGDPVRSRFGASSLSLGRSSFSWRSSSPSAPININSANSARASLEGSHTPRRNSVACRSPARTLFGPHYAAATARLTVRPIRFGLIARTAGVARAIYDGESREWPHARYRGGVGDAPCCRARLRESALRLAGGPCHPVVRGR